jgi:hypothetical protein
MYVSTYEEEDACQCQSGAPLHAMVPGEDVLEGNEHGMSHMQPAGHVGRRHGKDIGLLLA